jgi:hypothetical protein
MKKMVLVKLLPDILVDVLSTRRRPFIKGWIGDATYLSLINLILAILTEVEMSKSERQEVSQQVRMIVTAQMEGRHPAIVILALRGLAHQLLEDEL